MQIAVGTGDCQLQQMCNVFNVQKSQNMMKRCPLTFRTNVTLVREKLNVILELRQPKKINKQPQS